MSQQKTVVRFYLARDEYGCFSNFSRHRVFLKVRSWPTPEHGFQAQKCAGTPHEEEIGLAKGPSEAAALGRSRRHPLRADWEQVKDAIMREVVLAKFTQHDDLRA